MAEKICGAYTILHLESGQKYIGSSDDLHARKGQHLRSLRSNTHINSGLQAAFNQDQDLQFNFHPTDTREEAFDVEQLLLDTNWGKPELLNRAPIARNPGIGQEWTPERIQKLSDANKGKQPWLGKKHSEETKAKMSAAATLRPERSDEEKQRLRELRVGIPHREEVRQRMSESHRGKPSGAAIPVMINGVEYRSGLDAARQLGMSASAVKKKLNDPTNQEFVKLEKKL